jgi:3',5'-cyclic AMP phosphodiesterase CpdA
VVHTGDVADTGSADEYAQFFAAFRQERPAVVVPGNHDLRAGMARHVPADENGFLNRAAEAGEITIIGLDSLSEGEIGGRLAPSTIAFARDRIVQAPGHVVLALHHPPIPIGHTLMDQHGLYETEPLDALIRENPQVAAVLCGHVHTAVSGTFANRPVLGAPGVVSEMRLGSRTDPIADQGAVPGLALHTIDEAGQVTTVFHPLSPNGW